MTTPRSAGSVSPPSMLSTAEPSEERSPTGVAAADGEKFPARGAAAAAVLLAGPAVELAGPTADAGLGKDQLHAGGRLEVARDGGDDAASLLEPGQREERRRAAVRLHSGKVETLLGLGQLGDAVRVDGAARVHVRVDERCELGGGRQHGVEVETDLAQPPEVGAEPGDHDDLVDALDAAAVAPDDRQLSLGPVGDVRGAERVDHSNRAALDRGLCSLAQGAAGLELVVVPSAEGVVEAGATKRPHDLRLGGDVHQGGEAEERVLCRGTAAGDEHALAGVPV